MKDENFLDLIVAARKLRHKGKYEKALEVSSLLLKKAREADDKKAIMASYANDVSCHYSMGDMEMVIELVEAYDILCSEYGDVEDKINLNLMLFLIYDYNDDVFKSFEIIKRSIVESEKYGFYYLASNAYTNYSYLLYVEGNYPKSLLMSEKALEKLQGVEDSEILKVRTLMGMLSSYTGLKNIEKAQETIDRIKDSSILSQYRREKILFLMKVSEFYEMQEMYEEAIENAVNAKRQFGEYENLLLQERVEGRICFLYKKIGDIERGYKAQEEYIDVLKKVRERELYLKAMKLNVKHNLKKIENRANIDYLSGVHTRSYLEDFASIWLEEAKETKESIVCMVFDLDGLKGINDRYGHLIGDEAIRVAGRVALSVTREEDLVARYGGDEFVIILRRSNLKVAQSIGRRLQKELSKASLYVNGEEIKLKMSIGLKDNELGEISDFRELFGMADNNLYMAKKTGKNRICTE